MKKFIIMSVILGFVALPVVAAVQKATLINSTGKKVVVEVGSQQAKQYFGQGYKLMTVKTAKVEEKPWYENVLDIFGAPNKLARDIIGTQTGTSTDGVQFGTTKATTTIMYPIYIGNEVSNAVFTFKTKLASSTASVIMNVLESNDPYCDTSSTTSSMNIPVQSEINWFDAAYHIKGLAGATTIPAATSTVVWAPTGANQARSLILTDLNARCLGLNVMASGTNMYAQLVTK